jgi:adenine/guanine phosphoribosyltransferase-like PRPP-binding protein
MPSNFDLDLTNVGYAIPIVQKAVATDRPGLFNLADQAISRFPEKSWDIVVSDACRGILVGNFLTRVLNSGLDSATLPSVRHIPIANSRNCQEMRHRRSHSKAVVSYLKELKPVRRALVVTDFVDTGHSLKYLGNNMRKAGIEADFAVLGCVYDEGKLRRISALPKSSDLYANTLQDFEPETAGSTIKQGLGLICIPGVATPQPGGAPWLDVGTVVNGYYDLLATEYLASPPAEGQ